MNVKNPMKVTKPSTERAVVKSVYQEKYNIITENGVLKVVRGLFNYTKYESYDDREGKCFSFWIPWWNLTVISWH